MTGSQAFVIDAAAMAAIVLWFATWYLWTVHGRDDRHEKLPRLPAKPDPYRIAYLRGGADEVVDIATYDLLRHNKLEVVKDPIDLYKTALRTTSRKLGGVDASPLRREILDFYGIHPADRTKSQAGFRDAVEAHCAVYRVPAETDGLLYGADLVNAVRRNRVTALVGWTIGLLFLIALGMLAKALTSPLAVFCFFFAAGCGLLPLCLPTPRLTPRGKEYLAWLEQAHSALRWAPKRSPLLAAGCFGTSVLTALYAPSYYGRAVPAHGDAGGGCDGGGCGGDGGGCGGGCGE